MGSTVVMIKITVKYNNFYNSHKKEGSVQATTGIKKNN